MLKTKPQTIESKNANFYPSPIFFPIYGFDKEQMIRPYETYKSQLLAKFQPDLRFVRFDSDQYFVNLTNYPGKVRKKIFGGMAFRLEKLGGQERYYLYVTNISIDPPGHTLYINITSDCTGTALYVHSMKLSNEYIMKMHPDSSLRLLEFAYVHKK